MASQEQSDHIASHVNESVPELPLGASLCERWQRAHRRMEEAEKEAERQALVKCSRQAERCKGSGPKSKPTSPPSNHQKNESVKLRRLQRIHRQLNHLARGRIAKRENLEVQLSPDQSEKFARAVVEGLTEHTDGIPSLGVAIEVVVAGVVKAEEENRREATK